MSNTALQGIDFDWPSPLPADAPLVSNATNASAPTPAGTIAMPTAAELAYWDAVCDAQERNPPGIRETTADREFIAEARRSFRRCPAVIRQLKNENRYLEHLAAVRLQEIRRLRDESATTREVLRIANVGLRVAIEERNEARAEHDDWKKAAQVVYRTAQDEAADLRQQLAAERARADAASAVMERMQDGLGRLVERATKAQRYRCANALGPAFEVDPARVFSSIPVPDAPPIVAEWKKGLPELATVRVTLQDFLAVIQEVENNYPVEIFPADGESQDCKSALMARCVCKNIRRAILERAEQVAPVDSSAAGNGDGAAESEEKNNENQQPATDGNGATR